MIYHLDRPLVVHTYRTICTTVKKPPGLGDFLRGCFALAILADEKQFNLLIDLSLHPISNFLCDVQDIANQELEVQEFFNERQYLLFECINTLQVNNQILITTNAFPEEKKITKKIRELIQSQFKFNSSIEKRVSDIKEKISNQEYAVLHIRVSDNDFHRKNIKIEELNEYVKLNIIPRWEGRIAVLSNNQGKRI